MFKKLKNKIQVELDKEQQSSTNVSMCSSMSSSRADLTQEDQNLQQQNQKNQAFDSLAALVSDEIEEEDDSEEILQKFTKPVRQASSSNLMSLNEDNQKSNVNKEPEKVLDDLLIKVENSIDENNIKAEDKPFLNNHQVFKNGTKLINDNSIDKNDQIIKMNEKIKSKTNELDDLKERFKKLELELKDQINENKKLENLNLNLQSTKHEVNLRNNKLFNKLDELKKQSKQTEDKITKLKEENRILHDKNKELKQIIESLKENLEFEKEEKAEIKNEFYKFKMGVQMKSESTKNEKLIDELNEKIAKLKDQVGEKNKTIKLQNQRIHDIKKSLQKGDLFLKDEQQSNQSTKHQSANQLNNGNFENGYSSRNGSSTKLDEQIVNGSQNESASGKLNNNKDYATHVNDINFKYLQNVVLKFITSNDPESQKHLVKAISTLLKFSKDEEQYIKQSLETRNSWFKI